MGWFAGKRNWIVLQSVPVLYLLLVCLVPGTHAGSRVQGSATGIFASPQSDFRDNVMDVQYDLCAKKLWYNGDKN